MRSSANAQGWAIVSVVFCASACVVGTSQYAFGLFLQPLQDEFGWSRTQISASLSFTAIGALASPFIGRLMDQFGARFIMFGALLCISVSFLLRPLMSELWHWYALSLLQFIAFTGATMLPAGKLVGRWFPQARGRVLGIVTMGNNFGGLIMPALLAVVVSIGSWRAGFSLAGAMIGAIALAVLLVVREQPARASREPDKLSTNPSNAPPTASDFTLKMALRTRAFYAIVIAVCLGSFTYGALLPHILAHLTNVGLTAERASLLLGALAISGLMGKLLFGWLAERIGVRKATILDLTGQAIFISALVLFPQVPALVLLTPLFGLFMGGFGVLMSLLVQDTFGLSHFGAIMGVVTASTVLPYGLGPVLAGLSYDYTGSYGSAFLIVAGLFLLAAATLAACPWRPHRGFSAKAN